MIHLKNGHKLDFLISSGALGFDGNGYLWEWPFRWAGYLDSSAFTIVTKTLTYKPKKGNFNWFSPWRSFYSLGNGNYVNALGLPNPGYEHWIKYFYPNIKNLKIIVSIAPENTFESLHMSRDLNKLKKIVGIELNISCPNHPITTGSIIDIFIENTSHPVILKLGYKDIQLCRDHVDKVSAFHLINSVPWGAVFGDEPSPLESYGYRGAVSGPIIKPFARDALAKAAIDKHVKIISGGGIDSVEEVYTRFVMGAKAASIGTLFLQKPWESNRIVEICRKEMKSE